MSAAKLIRKAERVQPTAEYMTVTPQMAQEWLDTNRGRNRNLNNRRVEMYAAAMQRGDWMTTGQGISFDEQGNISDGQHRLHAIVKADVPIVLLVITQVPGRSQLVVDMGLKRTPHDQLALREGWDVTPMHTAVAKAMVDSVGGAGTRDRRLMTTDIQLLDRFYIRHHKAIEWAVARIHRGHAVVKGVTIAPMIAPVARAYYSHDINKLGRFGDVVATGMADSPGDGPAVVLRNYLIAGREKQLSSRAARDRYVIYKKTELALWAFLKGNEINRLGQMQLDRELFPIPNDPVRYPKKVPVAT